MSTTIDDAVTGISSPATSAPADDVARGHRGASAIGWLGDLVALAPLVVLLPGLTGMDGGRGLAGTWPLALAAALALPVAWTEVRRLPRPAVALLATWTAALAVGVVAARYRSDMVLPLLQYTIAPTILLATRRVWRRPWAPGVVLALLGFALARYQVRSWLDWWAQTEGGTGFWRPLSWRNPSAALTGMMGVWLLGAGLMSARVVRVGLGLLAATAFAGAWLTSSRAGVVVTVGAAVVAVAIAVRAAHHHGRSVLAPILTAVAVLATTGAFVAGLLAMQPSGSDQAIAARDQEVSHNLFARIEHSEAALGMFADRPLAGQGLGSYRRLAPGWTDPEGNLTSSAHNEYAEVAGETGVLGLLALVGTFVGLAWLGVRQFRRPPQPGSLTDLRPGMAVGATAAAALFLVHSAVDFDWYYPVLSGMAAMAAAIIIPDTGRSPAPRWLTGATAGLLCTLLAGGVALAVAEQADTPAPWREVPHVSAALESLHAGRPDAALESANAALRWNPGSPAARSVAALAQYEIDDDAERLLTSLEAHPTWFDGRARAAIVLAEDGRTDMAEDILPDLHEDLDTHAAWGVTSSRLLAVEAEVVVAAHRSCPAAHDVVARWTRGGDRDGRLPSDAEDVLRDRLELVGCEVE